MKIRWNHRLHLLEAFRRGAHRMFRCVICMRGGSLQYCTVLVRTNRLKDEHRAGTPRMVFRPQVPGPMGITVHVMQNSKVFLRHGARYASTRGWKFVLQTERETRECAIIPRTFGMRATLELKTSPLITAITLVELYLEGTWFLGSIFAPCYKIPIKDLLYDWLF